MIDTMKFKMGWAIITVSGLISKERAKLRRAIINAGGQKMVSNCYAVSGIAGRGGIEALVNRLKSVGSKETSFRAIYVTRAQWDAGFICHGETAKIAA